MPQKKKTAYLEFLASQDGPLKEKHAKWRKMSNVEKNKYKPLEIE